jgi:hypothetical protein
MKKKDRPAIVAGINAIRNASRTTLIVHLHAQQQVRMPTVTENDP